MITAEYSCLGELCFDWHASGASSDFDVVISWKNENPDSTNWLHLDTISTNGSGSPTSYQNYYIDFPLLMLSPPFDQRIRWQMIRRNGGTFYLENVCMNGDTCFVTPTQLSFSDIGGSCKEVNRPIFKRLCARFQWFCL
jgi:hypothetical protein